MERTPLCLPFPRPHLEEQQLVAGGLQGARAVVQGDQHEGGSEVQAEDGRDEAARAVQEGAGRQLRGWKL